MHNIKRIAAAGTLAAGLVASFTIGTAEAGSQAARAVDVGAVRITVMGINAPGADTMANRNKEYVWIKNTGTAGANVYGWRLRDGYGVRFNFRPNKLKDLEFLPARVDDPATTSVDESRVNTLTLPAGHSVIVYTGAGKDVTPGNSDHSVYLNAPGHYLNNSSGEDVQLRDASGATVDQIRYDAYGINPTP